MRARNWILGFAASTAAVIAVVGTGCGGSENSGPPTPDAAVDVAVDHSVDTAPDVAMDAAMMCAVDADLTTLTFDAGADGGACIACVKSHCSMAISDCNKDCDCKTAFIAFFDCTSMGGTLINCAIQNLSNIDPTIQGELQNCAPPCANTCGVMVPDGGRDGEAGTVTDGASSDAPTEGG